MNPPNRTASIPLAQHYKLLDLQVGTPFKDVEERYFQLNARLSRSKHRNSKPAHKFQLRINGAFQALKAAQENPESVPQAPSHPLRNVQNASAARSMASLSRTYLTQAQRSVMQSSSQSTSQHFEPSNKQSQYATHMQPEHLQPTQQAMNTVQPSMLNPTPAYTPTGQVMEQAPDSEKMNFCLWPMNNKNIMDTKEDRSVLLRKFNLSSSAQPD